MLRGPSAPRGSRADPARALHHHVERLQRLGRTVPVHRRDTRLVRTTVGGRVPGEAGADAAEDAADARPRGDGVLRVGASRSACRSGAAAPVGGTGSGRSCVGRSRTATGSTSRPHTISRCTPRSWTGTVCSLRVGHDEYWSWGMRDALDAHIAAGGNAAIFSGNTCFWQVRFEDDGRAMTCFKYRADEDPVLGTPDERFLSGPWSDRRVGRPETSTIGLTFTRGGYSRYGLGVPRASGALHRVARRSLGRSRAPAFATATRSASRTRSSRTRSTAARSHRARRAARPDPRGRRTR